MATLGSESSAPLIWPDVQPAEVEWRAEGPYSPQFEDVYYSKLGGVQETDHVFIEGTEIRRRWRGRECFGIGETGFGTGLNFLKTWLTWREAEQRPQQLTYLSIEGFPLELEDLKRASATWPEFAELGSALCEAYPALTPGVHLLEFERGRVRLILIFAPVDLALESIAAPTRGVVDAWFLDGFAPARNPDMWTEAVFSNIARLSRENATLATYSVASRVREALRATGFEVERAAGYANKRHMLKARLVKPMKPPTEVPLSQSPWELPSTSEPHPLESPVAVIGAGLAGVACGVALSKRGYAVTIYDQAGSLGAGASAVPAGIFHGELRRGSAELERWYTNGADLLYRHLAQESNHGAAGFGLEGVEIAQRFLSGNLEGRELSARFCQNLAGESSRLGESAIRFLRAGWLDPRSHLERLAKTPGLTFRFESTLNTLEPTEPGWRLAFRESHSAEAAVVVLAAAGGSRALGQTGWLPLRPFRGQVTQVASTERTRTVVDHAYYFGGYATPSHGGVHTIGSSFGPGETALDTRAEDDRSNLARFAAALPHEFHSADICDHWAHVRYGTPDHRPLVGAIPDVARVEACYEGLRNGRHWELAGAVPRLRGLYVSSGHGSRGFVSSLLAGEVVAALISGDTPPIDRALLEGIDPVRFLLRQLRRG